MLTSIPFSLLWVWHLSRKTCCLRVCKEQKQRACFTAAWLVIMPQGQHNSSRDRPIYEGRSRGKVRRKNTGECYLEVWLTFRRTAFVTLVEHIKKKGYSVMCSSAIFFRSLQFLRCLVNTFSAPMVGDLCSCDLILCSFNSLIRSDSLFLPTPS